MIELAVAVAAASLLVALAAAYALRLAPTLWLQLAGLAFLSVCVPLAAVLLSGWVMFHMGADQKILIVAAASASAAVVASLVLAHSIAHSIRRVDASSQRLATGDLAARAPAGGAAEIARLAASFNAMAASLEQLFDARRELVAWASHDLRTPIASLQAMLEALEDGLAQPEDYLPVLRAQVRALSLLVDDLFELARIDAGQLRLELQRVHVASLVDSALRLLEPDAVARGIELTTDIESAAEATAAPEKVERVLYNLVTNALRHTPSDGTVAVRARRLGDEVVVEVADTGEGLERRRGRADVRALLARRPRPLRHRRRPRPRDRPRHRRSPRRTHLGREPPPGRRADLLHPPGRRRPEPRERRRGSRRSRLTDARRRIIPRRTSETHTGPRLTRARLRPVTYAPLRRGARIALGAVSHLADADPGAWRP